MSRFFLLAASVLFIALTSGAAFALTPIEQAGYTALNQQVQARIPASQPIAGGPFFPDESGALPAAANPDRAGQVFPGNIAMLVGVALLLGIVALAVGLSTGGVKALLILDQTEYSPYEAMNRRLRLSPALTSAPATIAPAALTAAQASPAGDARSSPVLDQPDRAANAVCRDEPAPCRRLREPETAMECGRCL